MDTKKTMADFQFMNNKLIEFRYYGIIHFIENLTESIEESKMFKIHLKMRGDFIGSKNSLDIDKFREML